MRVIAFAIASLLSRPLLACSVCGCDPAAGTLGLDRPGAQSLRLAVEDRYLTKESGDGADAESEREDRLLLRTQFAPLERLVVQVELPWYVFKRHLNALGVQDDNATGIGDVALAARYELLRVGIEARHVIAVIGQLKLPTGPNARHLPGEVPDEHIQLGTGTFDEFMGISYAYGIRPWTLYANVTGRLNGTNERGFHYGNALFATLGARRAFGGEGRFVASIEAQARSAGEDRLADGSHDANSGGKILYATGSAAYSITDNLLVRALVQVPTLTALDGVQSEHPVAYLTLSYDFSL